MTSWDDDVFDRHPLWERVDTVAGLLEHEQLPDELDAPQRASVIRLKTAVELLREHQQKGLKNFYTQAMLDNVDAQLLNAVTPPLSSFINDSDNYGNQVNDAAAQAELIFTYVAQWPALPPGGQAQVAGRAFSEYKKEAEYALEVLSGRNVELEAEINKIKAQLTDVETQVNSVSSAYQASLGERENEYIEAINRVEASGEEAYDKAIEADVATRVEVLEKLEMRARSHMEHAEKAQIEAEELAIASKDSADWLAQRAVATTSVSKQDARPWADGFMKFSAQP